MRAFLNSKTTILFSIIILLQIYSCQNNLDNTVNVIPEPLPNIQISEGNIWLQTSVLPDTGDQTHYVSARDITVDKSNNIYVSTDFAGVFKSTDDGKTWTINNVGLIPDDKIQNYYFFVSSLYGLDKYIFAGKRNSIYNSSDNAKSWTLQKNLDEMEDILSIKAKNSIELFAGASLGIYKTVDMGNTWTNISPNIDRNYFVYAYDLEFTADGWLYAAIGNGIMRTSNNGNNWEYIKTPLYTNTTSYFTNQIEIDKGNKIYINVYNQIHTSTDGGNTWQQIFKLNRDGVPINCLLVNNKGTIFVGSYEGLYRSQDSGKTFQLIGLANLSPYRIIYDRNGRLIVLTYRKGVYISPQ